MSQWVGYLRKTADEISELEEAFTVCTRRKVWERPTVKRTWPILSTRCGNLITYDDSDGTVFLAHHSVSQFLNFCFSTPSIANDRDGDRYLGEICISYLNFTGFQKRVFRTADSSALSNLSGLRNLGLSVFPGRLYLKYTQTPISNPPIPVEEHLRTIMAQSLPPVANPKFELLDYCRSNWYQHCVTVLSEEEIILPVRDCKVSSTRSFHSTGSIGKPLKDRNTSPFLLGNVQLGSPPGAHPYPTNLGGHRFRKSGH